MPTWPLAAILVPYPVWWALGLGDFVFLILAVPLAITLIGRDIRVGKGFGLWLGFLAVVGVSALALVADAPNAVPGGTGGRLLTYGYRLAWYAAATVALLYAATVPERDLPFQRVSRWLAWMFVVTTAGGLLGVLAPRFGFTSVTELLLPRSLASNPFLHTLIHPATADVEDVLGYPQARPRAPFAYANSWGANFSFFLPFFLYSWCRPGSGWRRWAAVPVLAVAAVAVVWSLNRGLWIVLLIGLGYGLVQMHRRHGPRIWPRVVPVLALVLVVLAFSPLAATVSERLDNPHSNGRRGELAEQTVQSMLTGSPVIGFGNVRDVQGSFASIAGGATADCRGCGVPPLGTQGHAWLVLFSQGLAGAALFFGFFLGCLRRSFRGRDPATVIGVAVVLFFLVETFVYDTLGSPFFTVMLAIGLMYRAARTPQETP